jgi:hypothetical protein
MDLIYFFIVISVSVEDISFMFVLILLYIYIYKYLTFCEINFNINLEYLFIYLVGDLEWYVFFSCPITRICCEGQTIKRMPAVSKSPLPHPHLITHRPSP